MYREMVGYQKLRSVDSPDIDEVPQVYHSILYWNLLFWISNSLLVDKQSTCYKRMLCKQRRLPPTNSQNMNDTVRLFLRTYLYSQVNCEQPLKENNKL